MNDRSCQECSESLPQWAEFCPFCGSKYRATRVLDPVAAEAPIKTQILYLGTTDDGFDEAGRTMALHGVTFREEPKNESVGVEDPAPAPQRTIVDPTETAEVPRVNPDAVALFDDDDDFDFDPPPLRSRSQIAIVVTATLLTIVALGYGAFLIATEANGAAISDLAAAEINAPEAPEEEPEPKLAPLPEMKPFDVVANGKKSAMVTYGGQDVLEILTAKGSRYDDVTQRAKSVTVRLEHIAQKQRESRDADARFVARVNGDRYEVVWDDGSAHPFRVTDVTKHDVEKGDDLAIEANLRADALTDLFRRDIAPVQVPTS